MIGENTIHINPGTMMKLLTYALNETTLKNPVDVVRVEANLDYPISGSFIVTIKEREEPTP